MDRFKLLLISSKNLRFSLLCLSFALLSCGLALAAPGLSSAPLNRLPGAVDTVTLAQFGGVRPNEAGRVPILEYHNITTSAKLTTYAYPAKEFRKDMEWLYAHNYRPINLSDYIKGWIDCPAGKSPVIITFDDALSGQFRYDADGKIDPNCAVGILDAMNAEHPDWKSRATFFVLTNEDPHLPAPFVAPLAPGQLSQANLAGQKMAYLVKDGFEIGNHTLHHSMFMKRMTPQQVEAEFAGGEKGILKYLPGYDVDTLALPYGVFPRDLQTLKAGESNGISYHNICAMAAGAQPAPSPISTTFEPYDIPRIIPGNQRVKPGGICTIRYWLQQLEEHPSEKFVSDGNPQTYTVPASECRKLNLLRVKDEHYVLQSYRG